MKFYTNWFCNCISRLLCANNKWTKRSWVIMFYMNVLPMFLRDHVGRILGFDIWLLPRSLEKGHMAMILAVRENMECQKSICAVHDIIGGFCVRWELRIEDKKVECFVALGNVVRILWGYHSVKNADFYIESFPSSFL